MSHRNVFQNSVNSLSKIVNYFLSKNTKFCMVRTIRLCSNFISMRFKYLTNNVWRNFRLNIINITIHFFHICKIQQNTRKYNTLLQKHCEEGLRNKPKGLSSPRLHDIYKYIEC